MIANNLTIACRNLIRNKAFTLINIIGLSLGITSALVITIFIRYELSFDQYHTKSDKIYKVVEELRMADDTYYWSTTCYPLAEAIRNDFSELPMVTQASGPVSRMFKVEDLSGEISRFEEQYVLYVDPSFPKAFDFQWIQGDPATALTQTNSVVLTQHVADKFFPKEIQKQSILGRQIFLNNKDALTVTGLIENAPSTTSLTYSMLIPYEFFRINNPYPSGNWSGNYQGSTFLMLKDGQSPKDLEHELLTWKKKYLKPEDDNRITYHLLPVTESHTNETYKSAPQSYVMPSSILYGAAGIAVFMLLIACVNFINLSTAQAASRAREVGVRKVMGSSRFGLVRQFLMENILLVGIAVILSIAFAQLALSQINTLLAVLRLQLTMSWSDIGIVLSMGAGVVILACLYPAVAMASYKPVEALKNKVLRSSSAGLSLRRSLIVFQFCIVQLFIIGTLIVSSQMKYMQNKDLGFSTDNTVVLTNLNELEKSETFRQRLLLNPAIQEVSFSSSSPMSDYGNNYGTSFWLPGQPEEDGQEAEEKGVDVEFLSFYKMHLLAGRNFISVKPDFDEFIVNEKLIKGLGWSPAQAIGQRLVINEGEATIVGVVSDFHNQSLQGEITPCVFLNSSGWLERSNIKLTKGSDISETAAFIEKTWKEIYPEGIFKATFLDDAMEKKYGLEQFIFRGFSILSVLTIVIGCLGLYGLLSFIALRKTKEVGIRKTLGASVTQIVTLFSREFIMLVVVAFLIATPLCYYLMNGWLRDFAYHIELSWWMFTSGGLLTIFIALATISYKSIKAALANPVDALRSE